MVELTAETRLEEEHPVPWELTPEPGGIAIQLRSTLRRVAVGAGLARRAELLDAVRALPGLPGLVTSPAGGTFVIGGPAWVGICALAVPPTGVTVPPLDWAMAGMRRWFEAALLPLGLQRRPPVASRGPGARASATSAWTAASWSGSASG